MHIVDPQESPKSGCGALAPEGIVRHTLRDGFRQGYCPERWLHRSHPARQRAFPSAHTLLPCAMAVNLSGLTADAHMNIAMGRQPMMHRSVITFAAATEPQCLHTPQIASGTGSHWNGTMHPAGQASPDILGMCLVGDQWLSPGFVGLNMHTLHPCTGRPPEPV